MTINTPPDQRTTSQKFMHAHTIMERAVKEEAYTIVAVYAEDISEYLIILESDARSLMYDDDYVECGILDD